MRWPMKAPSVNTISEWHTHAPAYLAGAFPHPLVAHIRDNELFYFYGCRLGLYSELRWSADGQVSGSSFPGKAGANSETAEYWKAWLAWAGLETKIAIMSACHSWLPQLNYPTMRHFWCGFLSFVTFIDLLYRMLESACSSFLNLQLAFWNAPLKPSPSTHILM